MVVGGRLMRWLLPAAILSGSCSSTIATILPSLDSTLIILSLIPATVPSSILETQFMTHLHGVVNVVLACLHIVITIISSVSVAHGV